MLKSKKQAYIFNKIRAQLNKGANMLTFAMKGKNHDGVSCSLDIAVRSPFLNNGEWCCEIVIFGIPSFVKTHIFGTSPLQAYCLATAGIYHHLQAFTKEGGELYYDDGTPMTLTSDLYFPHFTEKPQ